MKCLHCGKKLGVFRKLSDSEFCSVAHRKAHQKKQQDEALEYLLRHKPGSKPQPSHPPATPQQPDPEASGFIQLSIGFATPPTTLRGHEQALRLPAIAVLPRTVDAIPSGAMEPCTCRTHCVTALSRMEYAGASHGDAVGFPIGLPERDGYAAPVRPVWIEPQRKVESPPKLAAFAALPLHPAKVAAEVKHDSGDCRNPCAPSLASSTISAKTPALRPAALVAFHFKAQEVAALSPAGASAAWTLMTPSLQIPGTAHARVTARLAGCKALAAGRPAASPGRPTSPIATGVDPLHAEMAPEFPTLRIILHRRWLDPAPGATLFVPGPAAGAFSHTSAAPADFSTVSLMDAFPLVADSQPPVPGFAIALRQPRLDPGRLSLEPPPWAKTATPVSKREAATFIGQLRIHLDTNKRLAVIPPRPPNPPKQHDESPLRPRVSALRMRERRPLVDIWRFAPNWTRRLVIALTLTAIGVFGVPRLASIGPAMKLRGVMQNRLARRAGIDLQDDFRSGLSRWTGAPGWAKTWSYDPTGFVRPGRVALLDGSQALTDYRLEFTAQIDKKAVGWVFRATDTRNYYATKLVESKNDGLASFTIQRYVVIDGRESLKVQLPLPAVPAAKSLYRLRQEVQGTQFTTYLDGRLIDTWSDGALDRGGAGLFADPGEVAYVRRVDIAHQDDLLGRICSYLSKANGR